MSNINKRKCYHWDNFRESKHPEKYYVSSWLPSEQQQKKCRSLATIYQCQMEKIFSLVIHWENLTISHPIEPVNNAELNDCNKTIHLSRDNTKVSITTPAYPRYYPDNMNCFSFIIAPSGYRILIEFEEFVLEQEPQCAYDHVEMFELKFSQNGNGTSRQEKINGLSSSVQQQQQQQFNEFPQLLQEYEQQKNLQPRNIFQPSNSTYNIFKPPPSTLDDRMPRKMCGDWSSKLKLLRHRSENNFIGLRFFSDYSHHFGGFKAKISLEKGMRSNFLCVWCFFIQAQAASNFTLMFLLLSLSFSHSLSPIEYFYYQYWSITI